MKRIKKFESFTYPMPKEITSDEWDEQISTYEEEEFDEKEMEFYEKLKKDNPSGRRLNDSIYDFEFRKSKWYNSKYKLICIDNDEAFFNFETNSGIDIEITKLRAEWYLIHEFTHGDDDKGMYEDVKLFLCDQWEEVIGYLQSKTSLIIGFIESKINSNPTLKDWNGDDKISKEYSFNEFKDALEFIRKVAQLSEIMNHHPEINWNYDKVKITLFTHDEGKVTKKDIDLARKIDEIKI